MGSGTSSGFGDYDGDAPGGGYQPVEDEVIVTGQIISDDLPAFVFLSNGQENGTVPIEYDFFNQDGVDFSDDDGSEYEAVEDQLEENLFDQYGIAVNVEFDQVNNRFYAVTPIS